KGIDDADSQIVSSVHVLKGWDNGMWNGQQMIYGDGDGVMFGQFAVALDIIGHELTHGVTNSTSKLLYVGESGALNEGVSDAFGVMVKHSARPDDPSPWCLAKDILVGSYKGKCARDMAHPGRAVMAQPSHMSEFASVDNAGFRWLADTGGVHLNSG